MSGKQLEIPFPTEALRGLKPDIDLIIDPIEHIDFSPEQIKKQFNKIWEATKPKKTIRGILFFGTSGELKAGFDPYKDFFDVSIP